MAVTGIIKVLCHVFDIPASLVSAATTMHDIGTLLMLLSLVAHVFFAVLLPRSWKMAPSMIHEWIDEKEVAAKHPAWYELLTIQSNIMPQAIYGILTLRRLRNS